MNILDKARRLESRLARSFEGVAEQWTRSEPRGPLEVMHAVMDAVAERLEPAGRGTHVFPFNRIKVTVVARSRHDRARFGALFDAAPNLQERVTTCLRDAGCEPANLQVRVAYADQAAPDWTRPDMHVDFDRVAAADVPPERPSAPEPIKLTVAHGAAEKPSYTFAATRVNLGRCTEVRDTSHRLVRTNHVAFVENGDSPNVTVSRRHAHIEYAGEYRLCDDGSAHGTGIVRNGRTIGVPSGSRGVRLRSGDEVLLGEARVRVRIGNG
jgi:hypothetical protein